MIGDFDDITSDIIQTERATVIFAATKSADINTNDTVFFFKHGDLFFKHPAVHKESMKKQEWRVSTSGVRAHVSKINRINICHILFTRLHIKQNSFPAGTFPGNRSCHSGTLCGYNVKEDIIYNK